MMPVNFEQEDERRKYLETKFSDLLENINSVYGKELMERLIKRLEKTIELFDKDVQGILKTMDDKESAFIQSLPRIEQLKKSYIKLKTTESEKKLKEKDSGDSVVSSDSEEDDDIIKKIEQRRKKK
ncbi:MAG: hypothetical protein KAI81_00800 [Candidatus Marinimicrobia bacterium]|nr:hypothetical protein [Candidatus Neomarinimicrobiota bacterium]